MMQYFYLFRTYAMNLKGALLFILIYAKQLVFSEPQVGGAYYYTNGHIYCVSHEIPSADTVTFRHLGGKYAADKNAVYYCNTSRELGSGRSIPKFRTKFRGFKIIENADPKSFGVLEWGYTADNKNVYFEGKRLKKSDPSHFSILSHQYAKSKRTVFYDGIDMYAHPGSFQVITNEISKDNFYVYIRKNRIKESHGKSFRFLGQGYGLDRRNVYFFERYSVTVMAADTESFKIHPDGYATDKDAVYISGRTLEAADPATFKLLNSYYSIDKDQVYYNFAPRYEIDRKNFEIIDNAYAKNDHSVYREGEKILDADGKSFKYLDGLYSKDAIRVYYGGEVIVGADAPSFETMGSTSSLMADAADKYNYYQYGGIKKPKWRAFFRKWTFNKKPPEK